MKPNNLRAMLTLAEAYERKGDKPGAREMLRSQQKIDPEPGYD